MEDTYIYLFMATIYAVIAFEELSSSRTEKERINDLERRINEIGKAIVYYPFGKDYEIMRKESEVDGLCGIAKKLNK